MNHALDSLRDYLKRIPHDPDTLHRVYEHLASTPPAFIVLGFITLLFVALAIKRFWRLAIYLAIGGVFLSFLVFASGRAVMRQAWNLPVSQRPACLVDAVYRGAVWSSADLKKAKRCRTKITRHGRAPDQTDSGSDGVLTGSISNSDWSAQISAPSPTASWQALTRSHIGNLYVYLIGPSRSWRISACPKLVPVPQQYLNDKTGEIYVDFFAKRAPSTVYFLLAPSAKRLIYDKGHSHRYRFQSGSGKVIGYLLPVAGEQGNCMTIDGPYLHKGKNFRFSASSTSRSSANELAGLADRLTAAGLHEF